MSRKFRIRRNVEDDDLSKLQRYVDTQIAEAVTPLLKDLFNTKSTVSAITEVLLWVDRDLQGLMNHPEAWHKLPAGVRVSMTGLKEKLNALSWEDVNHGLTIGDMMKQAGIKHGPGTAWLDEAMAEADDRDLAELQDDDF